MKQVLNFIFNAIGSMSPAVRAVLGIGSVALAINAYANQLWAELFLKVDTLAAGTFGEVNLSPCAFINYVFPLDTACTLLSAYAALVAICATIRIIKSFIPSIA